VEKNELKWSSLRGMIPLAPASLLVAFCSIVIGILLYGKDPTHVINRIVLLLSAVLFYWGFTEFEYLQASDVHLALFWMRLGAFWYMVPAMILHFSVVYANIRLRRVVLYSLTYAPAILLSFFDASGTLYQPVMRPWGWDQAYNYLGYVVLLWPVLASIAALLILNLRYRNAKTPEEKTGAVYILFGFLVPIATGISSGVLLPAFSIEVPDLTMPTAAIGFLLIGYAVSRYGVYVLTASAAAQDILSTMADALFLVNSTGEIVVSNTAASRVFEYEESELTGKTLNCLTRDSSTVAALISDNSFRNFETDLETKRGRAIPVSVSKSVIKTKGGNLAGCILICRDITERKRTGELLLKTERLAAIGETTAMVGHDLRNPLQAIVSTVYLAKKKLESPPEPSIEPAAKSSLVDMLETIEGESQYMNKIVSDLQDYSAPLKAELAQIDMESFVKETLSKMRIPKNVKVSLTVSEPLPRVMIDPPMMRRVFTNLILNAIQALPDGGELRIVVSREGEDLLVAFKDTGVGISEENMDKLFSPFFTTKAKGQGLGLPVCKRLVEAHGGSITVESKPREGSTFTVKLPLIKS
jgi:PAS domain S-box-containing protein